MVITLSLRALVLTAALVGLASLTACGGNGSTKSGSGGSSSSSASSSSSSASSSASSSTSASSSSSSGVVDIRQQAGDWPQAFVLPYDDASAGITQMGGRLNHTPAGVHGPLTTGEDGHFYVGDQRIRFWGVNITGASAFPSHADAEAVAARLAKFGVNIVRFHHMENNWGGPSLLDYSGGNSRTLDTANLEKLDYFISRLKAEGVYTNLNLQTSREFLPGDGLPDSILQLDWKQRHILGYVLPEALALEKEHASQLLTHTNPYTGLTYAQDPAVAVVEINNENSIYQQFLDGSLDTWPADLLAPLQARWNSWLAARYADDGELQTAWGAVSEPLQASLVANGNFASGLSNWNLEQHDSAVVSGTAGTYDGVAGMRLSVTQTGSASWHVQLNQGGLTLEEGQVYTLSFQVRASNHEQIQVATQQAYDPWGTYDSNTYSLSTSWQSYQLTFIAQQSDTNVRLNFSGLGTTLGTVDLANVQLQPGGELGQLPAGQSLADSTIAVNRFSERYTEGRVSDWMAFLHSLELEYWQGMKAYLKTDLQLQGQAYGTIVSLSPPSVQQTFGFIDGHSYWRHPVFPNQAWDAVDWQVGNDSMINTLSNTLNGLANQRVQGLPFTVSEYQHAMPNFYAAESPLLVAAYGAYQDWDGVYFFTYEATNGDWGANYFSGYFQTNNNPAMMANLAVAANLFRRADVSAAGETLVLNFDPDTEAGIIASSGRAWGLATGENLGTPAGTPFTTGLALDTSADPQGVAQAPALTNSSVLASDTGELVWDVSTAGAGVVTVNTARSKGVLGYVEGDSYSLGNLAVTFGQLNLDWAALMVTAQTGSFDNLAAGASLLAVANARVENTDMQWTDTTYTSVGNHWGRAPTVIEVVPFTLELPVAAGRVQAWRLDGSGQRGDALPVTATETGALITANGGTATLWYEIEIAAE